MEGNYADVISDEDRQENTMQLTMLKGKIHRAVVKQAELNYV